MDIRPGPPMNLNPGKEHIKQMTPGLPGKAEALFEITPARNVARAELQALEVLDDAESEMCGFRITLVLASLLSFLLLPDSLQLASACFQGSTCRLWEL
eukprot:703369-Pelagomonas_calceolata.AAC.1